MRFIRTVGAPILLAVSLCARAGAGAGPAMPEYTAYCNSPVAVSPEQATGSSNSDRFTAMAWNGQEFGVLYHDRNTNSFYFRRIYADGTPAAAPVLISSMGASAYGFNPSIVWNGNEYAIAWTGYTSPYFTAWFARVSRSGAFVSGPTPISNVGGTSTGHSDNPQIAWSGDGYAVAWEDSRNSGTTGYDIYYTMLDANGAVAGAQHDLALYAGLAQDDYSPRIAWSPSAGRYMVVWTHTVSAGVSYQVYGAGITAAGATVSLSNPIAGASATAINPDITGTSGDFGAVWTDARDTGGNNEIYFARFSGWGVKLGSDQRLTSNTTSEDVARIAWTGTEYGVFYPSLNAGQTDIWLARVSAGGTAAGAPQQLTFTGDAYYANAAFAQRGYLLTYSAFQNSFTTGPDFSLPIGCYGGAYTPGCPESPVAYSITGTSATLAWLPAYDPYTDIAYYQVYRNGALAGLSSAPVYTDGTLSTSGTYQYSFRTVNAGDYFSTGCNNSIYVKTNSSLTLTLGKSDPNALLNWTDGGLNSYNIFRGTSPQVMSQIGATMQLSSSDANALNSSASYFYTVDDPGQ